AAKAAASPAMRTAVSDRSLRAAEALRGEAPSAAWTDRVPSPAVCVVANVLMSAARHAPYRTSVHKPVDRFTSFSHFARASRRKAAYTLCGVTRERDLFANFERMRREMDELFGDVFGAALGRVGRNHGGFSPAVDVYYTDDPPRAVVHAELAGIDIDELG